MLFASWASLVGCDHTAPNNETPEASAPDAPPPASQGDGASLTGDDAGAADAGVGSADGPLLRADAGLDATLDGAATGPVDSGSNEAAPTDAAQGNGGGGADGSLTDAGLIIGAYGVDSTWTPFDLPSNYVYFVPIQVPAPTRIASMQVVTQAGLARAKMWIYADVGGAPSSLLAGTFEYRSLSIGAVAKGSSGAAPGARGDRRGVLQREPAPGTWLTADYQLLWNPGFNADRGPAHIPGGRIHAEV